ncbi:disease resistance protein [Striga asiatica]|uniref:Disease resistance protein n=1 Tax=Striga asiatica TaxID=4170 RepID=A0A5A7NZR9_STRAF|nr:disease resistance protein [Striga asiatica]
MDDDAELKSQTSMVSNPLHVIHYCDHVIHCCDHVNDLVHVWMAVGFLLPVCSMSLEEVGSFFHSTDNQGLYTMHDFARLVAHDVCFLILVVHYRWKEFSIFACFMTILYLCGHPTRTRAFMLFNAVKNNHTEVTETLLKTSENLYFLRFLDLSGNRFVVLPDVICTFLALQTLRLRDCPTLKELSEDLKDFTFCGILSCDGSSIKELPDMNSLRGLLYIKGLENVPNVEESLGARMSMKTRLETLELQWKPLQLHLVVDVEGERGRQFDVLASLAPHRDLEVLVIKNFNGALKIFSIVDLPKFVEIDEPFYGPGEVKFQSLESFELRNMSALKRWVDVGDTALPNVITYRIENCPILDSWPLRLASVCSFVTQALPMRKVP